MVGYSGIINNRRNIVEKCDKRHGHWILSLSFFIGWSREPRKMKLTMKSFMKTNMNFSNDRNFNIKGILYRIDWIDNLYEWY
jgi:hypothetical protein